MGKKPKLTPEEKKKLKAEKKLAKKLAAEEAKRQIKRDQLKRELEYGRRNREKLDKLWRKMLYDIKLPVLKIEFQLAVNNIERLLDAKDFTISFLMDELNEAEEQYMTNLRSHCENIDNLLDIYHNRLNELKIRYDSERNELIQSSELEMNDLKEKHNNEEQHLNTMVFGLEMEDKNVDKAIKSEYLSRLDEEKNKNSAEMQTKRFILERTFENLWNLYKEILKDYLDSTAQRKKEYDVLRKQDDWMRNKIKEQSQQIYDSYITIKKLKDRQATEKDELDDKVNDLETEKQLFLNAYNCLKNKLIQDTTHDEEQLIILVTESNSVTKNLQTKVKKAELILRTISVCRKYETRKEKVLPFPKSQPEVIPSKLVAQNNYSPNDTNELESFWQKCGQGNSLRFILNEEREMLKRQNHILRQRVINYCNDGVHGCVKLPPLDNNNEKKTVPVCEAAHIIKNLMI